MGVKIRWIRDKWYVEVFYKKRRIARAVGTDKKMAEKVRAQIEARLLVEGPDVIDRIMGQKQLHTPTLKEYGNTWMKDLEHSNLRESTRLRYSQSFVHHIEPCGIARKRLDEIDYTTIKGFIRELRERPCKSKPKPLSRNSIRNILAALRMILSEAEADGIITGNPAANKKLRQFYKQSTHREEVNPFTVEEVHQIESIFKDRWPWHYPLVVCLFRTGIRAGEARGLEWGDVNLRARKMTIKRSWSYGWAVSTTKTPSSRRVVDLSGDLVEVLTAWKAHLKQHWLKCGINDPGLVFPNKIGGPFDLRNFQRRCWNKAQEAAGIDIRRVHDARHTFATILLTGGVPITRVAHLLGHSSVRTTLQFYAHYLPQESDSSDISSLLDREVKMRAIREQSASKEVK